MLPSVGDKNALIQQYWMVVMMVVTHGEWSDRHSQSTLEYISHRSLL